MRLLLLLPLIVGLLLGGRPCAAGETLETVLARKTIRCGVSPDIPGLAIRDAQGRWIGMDTDFCRAMSAAVLGDPDKIVFLPLPVRARFSSLLSKEIDLLARNTSLTLGREAQLGVLFAGPFFITGQAFLVRAEQADKGLDGLNGVPIAVVKGSTHVDNILEVAARHNLTLQPVLFEDVTEAFGALLDGRCAAMTDDAPILAALRRKALKKRQKLELLPGLHSQEIISPVVRQDDVQWLLTAKAVLSVLLSAEELGLTSAALRMHGEQSLSPSSALFFKRTDAVAASLGLSQGWAGRVIAAVGNYAEIYERNLGSGSGERVKLDRGPNRLTRDGGLLYSLPF